jgi:hypothetical protein
MRAELINFRNPFTYGNIFSYTFFSKVVISLDRSQHVPALITSSDTILFYTCIRWTCLHVNLSWNLSDLQSSNLISVNETQSSDVKSFSQAPLRANVCNWASLFSFKSPRFLFKFILPKFGHRDYHSRLRFRRSSVSISAKRWLLSSFVGSCSVCLWVVQLGSHSVSLLVCMTVSISCLKAHHLIYNNAKLILI